MCGIAGIVHFNSETVSQTTLERFTHSLAHRGPDGWGVHVDGQVGLGHRRLAILDLAESGRCPMAYGRPGEEERYWITFNGEVYNFIELRRELSSLGHVFRSETDTEVVAASFAEWGESCLFRFNGMWAFAIWDSRSRELFLARDRFGVKPLYYTSGQRFAFASELKAFLSLENFVPNLNEALAEEALLHAQSFEGTHEETLLEGVHKLPAGHFMRVDECGKIRSRQWWNTADHLETPPRSYADQVEHWRELFLSAVAIRMRSDVPIGTSLSGGLDSSAVACAITWIADRSSVSERASRDWRHSFSATFPGTPLDESNYANLAAEAAGTRMHLTPSHEPPTAAELADSIWDMDDLYPAISVPVLRNYRRMRETGVYVSLDGHGADELLCGYTPWLGWPMNEVNPKLYDHFHLTLLPSILRNYDRASMAHGIESRMPLMDWRLVCFSFSLPAASKVGGGYTKRIFRDAVADLLPDSLRLRRSKIGFNSPMPEWFNQRLNGLLDPVIESETWKSTTYWDPQQSAAILRDRADAKSWRQEDWSELLKMWMRISFVIWKERFIHRQSQPFALPG